ncbi:hypothetical protein X564_12615 [Pseudoalteromonas agarivorans]|nr:hypothetical protein X564_12615 [Pseudoalteromonas agarivorans]
MQYLKATTPLYNSVSKQKSPPCFTQGGLLNIKANG